MLIFFKKQNKSAFRYFLRLPVKLLYHTPYCFAKDYGKFYTDFTHKTAEYCFIFKELTEKNSGS
ncbi:MAG: hypothetical protein DBY45_07950 [Clostridiales bacterium]|nr:MAG: hypothetical protein DBY45_09715 [Clostridiales bacterium]PWL43152.1 MAG: hypothetical protein DBY45_07950 [Clostridiales bacterium]